VVTDDDRISYLIGDEPAGDLDPEERAGLDDLLDALADPAVWAEPSPELEDRIVAAISDVGAAGPPASPGIAGPTAAAAPAAAATPPVVPLLRRRAVLAVVGLAAAVAAVIGLAIGLSGGSHRPTYHAALAGTSLAPAASGQVTMVQTVSGWQITLHAKGLPRLDNGQFYQAWLKNKAGILVPIGTFNQPNDVILWSGVPPYQFPVITVTRQKAGNLNSSGQRVLTGTAQES
jgi:Anti-sigma-K factor rskA, C-terminal